MFQIDTDICHCIVRHPDKAKFLVVSHEENWSPPVLMFPSGQIDFKASQINQGMLDKYGLHTRVLRPLVHQKHYHCIELELAVMKASRNLKAVWVDKAEYLRTRTEPDGQPDPFELWLEERESGQVPDNRAPHHQPGWFARADQWIQFQLDSLNIPVTGSVEQFRVGWSASCLLRVPTNQGWVYFKAGYQQTPAEPVLLEAMARRWPGHVFKPLAMDGSKDWMLNLDYFVAGKSGRTHNDLHGFAAAMAQLQIDSSQNLEEWKKLGCRVFTLENLLKFCRAPVASWQPWQEGSGGLSDQELEDFHQALQKTADHCEALGSVDLPMTLVHPDFRDENAVYWQGEHRFIDWSDTFIAHPFLVLANMYRDSKRRVSGQAAILRPRQISNQLLAEIEAAYLAPFAGFGSPEELTLCLERAYRLGSVVNTVRMLRQLETEEALLPNYFYLLNDLQTTARELIEACS